MKKPSASVKAVKVDGKWVRRPPPHPLRKRPPKNNLGGVTALFRAMGSDFRVPGRPSPRVRPPRKRPLKDGMGEVVASSRALGSHSHVSGGPDSAWLPSAPVAPKYMLDTNICIYVMEGGWRRIDDRFSLYRTGEMIVSAVTLAELRQGIALAADEETRRKRARALTVFLRRVPVLPFDAAAANCCEQLGVYAGPRERQNDKLIAAHAFQRKLTLVTNDLRHFNRYPGLRLENWT